MNELEVPQQELVRQCLYALQGVCGDVFHSLPNGSLYIGPLPAGQCWTAPGLSSTPIYDLLDHVVSISHTINSIVFAISDILLGNVGRPSGSVAEALAQWLRSLLSSFERECVRSLRACATPDDTITLLAMRDWLSPHERTLRTLHTLALAASQTTGTFSGKVSFTVA